MCCLNSLEAEVPLGEETEAVKVQLGEAGGVSDRGEVPEGEAEGGTVAEKVPLGE